MKVLGWKEMCAPVGGEYRRVRIWLSWMVPSRPAAENGELTWKPSKEASCSFRSFTATIFKCSAPFLVRRRRTPG